MAHGAQLLPFPMKILGNNVLLQPLIQSHKSTGGIFYSPNHEGDTTQFVIRAVGSGVKDPALVPGVRCLCHAHRGNKHRFDDGSIVMPADQIEMVWTTTPAPDAA